MEIFDGVMHIKPLMAVTIGIVVLFLGKRLNDVVKVLREYSIPEPVTGGLICSVLIALVYLSTGIEIEFDLAARDLLLIYFFTTIGINSSLRDLLDGGKPLVILLFITIGFMLLQNITGLTVAKLFGLQSQVGLLGGSISLIGGHGTAIAWAPRVAEQYGIGNAMEIGIACATFGLILASLMGGPIGKFLITKYNLKPAVQEPTDVGISDDRKADEKIDYLAFLDAILAIHVCMVFGMILNTAIEKAGLQLPVFVTCLFAGIIITNLIPKSFPRWSGAQWPSRKPSIALIADISLGTFLAMSLMSMQLWTLVDLAGPIFTILAAQLLVAVLVTVFVVFPAMGKTYDAAVVCAGFGGISLGSTPTAMANMSAVANRFGPSHLAFVIVPLVCAFFIDLVNAVMIPVFLSSF
jgi:ESS family glutamate:Na+ symporter